jgi:hypothetical protein
MGYGRYRKHIEECGKQTRKGDNYRRTPLNYSECTASGIRDETNTEST